MKCLTEEEASQWLRVHGHIEDPYWSEDEPDCKLVFHAPQRYDEIARFVIRFIRECVGGVDVLLVATDCWPEVPDREFVHETLRASIGETRFVEDAPAYLVSAEESAKAVALFSLMSGFGWKCYLYGGHDQLTLYNWEGDIYDLWTSSSVYFDIMRAVLREYGLQEIEGE